MESNKDLAAELKKVTRELASYKIELHQTRGYLHCILQNSRDMIFATDVTGIVVSFSKGAEKVLGYSLAEVIGRPITEFAEDPRTFEQVMNSCQTDGCAVTLDFHFRHKDGSRVHCHASLMSLTNREGGVVGTVGVCTDITQWKKLQDDLVQVDRLAEIGRIAAGVAHEMNNPLAVISEASGWAREVAADAAGLADDDRKELLDTLEKIDTQTRRCRHITHRLLDFTRDSAPAKQAFDVHELIRSTVELLRPELKHSPVNMKFGFSNDPLVVHSDPRLIEQVLVNIITNAVHAVLESGRPAGQIAIRTARTDSGVQVDIEDNGSGIAKENQDKMFKLFFTTKPPGKGTGLGLPICRNLMEKLGGEITFQTEPGQGTTFTLRIPGD